MMTPFQNNPTTHLSTNGSVVDELSSLNVASATDNDNDNDKQTLMVVDSAATSSSPFYNLKHRIIIAAAAAAAATLMMVTIGASGGTTLTSLNSSTSLEEEVETSVVNLGHYPYVHVINHLNEPMHVRVTYSNTLFCNNDEAYIPALGEWTATSRGVCLVNFVTAFHEDITSSCSYYSSLSTSYSQFEIKPLEDSGSGPYVDCQVCRVTGDETKCVN